MDKEVTNQIDTQHWINLLNKGTNLRVEDFEGNFDSEVFYIKTKIAYGVTWIAMFIEENVHPYDMKKVQPYVRLSEGFVYDWIGHLVAEGWRIEVWNR